MPFLGMVYNSKSNRASCRPGHQCTSIAMATAPYFERRPHCTEGIKTLDCFSKYSVSHHDIQHSLVEITYAVSRREISGLNSQLIQELLCTKDSVIDH